ncbi:MAG: hypothetical protein SPL30_02710 [Succinivibrio sp.]|nr:hypothetical protein [Succinivibrio sp.]
MNDQNAPMSPREQMLLDELRKLYETAKQTAADLDAKKQEIAGQENEISALRRDMISLKEENQHLREVLQTWRQRLDSVLSQLKSIN